jgi:thiamine monophosphate synthase
MNVTEVDAMARAIVAAQAALALPRAEADRPVAPAEPESDAPVFLGARQAAIRSAGLRLGLSTHGCAEMLRADALAPSHLALGAVFPTTLKAMTTAPQGGAGLRRWSASSTRVRA